MLLIFSQKIFGERHLCFGQFRKKSSMGTLTKRFLFRIFVREVRSLVSEVRSRENEKLKQGKARF
jgi:hypothetical protein